MKLVVALALLTALACTKAPPDTTGGADAGAGALAGPALLGGQDCDPLVPSECGYPFPSNVYLVDDARLPSGHRVAFGATTLPVVYHGTHMDASLWSDSDGFSPGGTILAELPGMSITGLPTQETLADSLGPASPTVLLEADTGARVAHFAELDRSQGNDADRALMIHPMVRLKDKTRYLVALRNVVDASGKTLPPTPVFKALRDGTDSTDPSVAPRRALYADLLAKLAAAGVTKDGLQLAWDFTTASRENNTRWMLSMRDQALATVGPLGPEYEVTRVTENPNPFTRRRIEGNMKVPSYLDKPEPGGTLVFGDDGMPKQNGTAKWPFVVQIPNSVADDAGPAPILINAHGLLGDKTEGQDGYLGRFAQEKKYVTVAVDFVGFDQDDNDLTKMLVTGDTGQFKFLFARQHQGMLNELLAVRLMKGRFASEPEAQFGGHSAIDPTQAFYRGDSQGGIFGSTFMALSTDVTRGFFGEPGMPYSLVLYRSVDFGDFFTILTSTYSSARDLALALGLLQMHWDRIEPDGYAPYVSGNLLPGTPHHDVLIEAGLGDHQVSPLGAEVVARTIGAKLLKPVARHVWGLEEIDGASAGSGIIEFDFGLPQSPSTNVPPSPAMGQTQNAFDDSDPHDKVRQLPATFDMTDAFLRHGTLKNVCAGDHCFGT